MRVYGVLISVVYINRTFKPLTIRQITAFTTSKYNLFTNISI